MQRTGPFKTVDELVLAAGDMDTTLESLMADATALPVILDTMSGLHDRLNQDMIRLCEQQMIAQGLGGPPVDYCWINMGSDARHEQALRTDQDNGLIYDDPKGQDPEAVDEWFQQLAHKVVHGLDQCGFDLCTGNVMAVNPKWRRSISQWSRYIEQWSRSLDPEDCITMTILLDFRPVWGKQHLSQKLWDSIFKAFESPEKINHMLTQEDLRFQIPIDLVGRIQTNKDGPHKHQVNLKTGIVHIVNGSRMFAVNNRITETSTLGRIKQLTGLGVFSGKQAGFFAAAFEVFARLRIQTNLLKIRQGLAPDNCIDPSTLTPDEQRLLRNAFMSASHMQKMIRNRFTQIPLNFFS